MYLICTVQVTKEVIAALQDVSFFVRACVSDMGSANQDLWKCVGIRSSRDNLTNYVVHPVRENCKLYFMADPPHLLKNIRNCLLAQTIVLPENVVRIHSLPSNIVRDLVSIQEGKEFKVAPSLKQVHVNPGKLQNMKVNLAAQVLSHSTATATALQLCVARKLLPEAGCSHDSMVLANSERLV